MGRAGDVVFVRGSRYVVDSTEHNDDALRRDEVSRSSLGVMRGKGRGTRDITQRYSVYTSTDGECQAAVTRKMQNTDEVL